tara:strand:+ start:770 stop:1135 length:366 start_codon:yes stop_codon:yes gene_type:complete
MNTTNNNAKNYSNKNNSVNNNLNKNNKDNSVNKKTYKPVYNKFSSGEINSMNKKFPWNGSIHNTHQTNFNNKYNNNTNILLATGDVDTNGRVYISANSNILNMSAREKEIFKRKHNIMDTI